MCSNLTANEIETMNCCFACFAVRAINPTGTYNTLRMKGPPFVFISKKKIAQSIRKISISLCGKENIRTQLQHQQGNESLPMIYSANISLLRGFIQLDNLADSIQ